MPRRARRALRESVRRRRRIVGMRRWDFATSCLLGVLVLGSLALGGLLFYEPVGTTSAALPLATGSSISYPVSTSDVTNESPSSLVLPVQETILFAGEDGDVGFSPKVHGPTYEVWAMLGHLLATLSASQVASAKRVGFKPVAEALNALNTLPTSQHAFGVDASFASVAPWADWLAAIGGNGGAARGPSFDRAIVLSPGLHGGGTLYLLAGASGEEIPLTAGEMTQLQSVVPPIRFLPSGSGVYRAGPLPPLGDLSPLLRQALALPGAVVVPTTIPGKPEALATEPLNPAHLEAAVFPDPLEVTADTSRQPNVFTNPQHWLLQVNTDTGQLTLSVPSSSAPAAAPVWYQGLTAALNYVDRVGGWPSTAWLASSAAARSGRCLGLECQASATGYDFSVWAGDLAVLPLPGRNVLAVTMSGDSTQPSSYARLVPVAGSVEPVPHAVPYTAAAAAEAALQVATCHGGSAAQLEVLQVFPAMVARPSLQQLRPVWVVMLGGGATGNPQTVFVDAYDGHVYDQGVSAGWTGGGPSSC